MLDELFANWDSKVINYKKDLLLLGLGNLGIVLPCSSVAILDHELLASCRGTGKGRGTWNLHCHPGLLILGAHFRQLLSSESLLSRCQELLWIFLRCMRITGCELSRLNPLFSDQSCAMSGDFILLGLALIHGEISYLLSVSLSTDGIIGQSFITKLDLVWLDCEVDTGQHGSGCDSTSARVGGWFLVTGRICSTAQGTRDLLTWCSLQFLHSCQVFWDGNLAEEAPFKSGCSVSLSIINFNLPLSFS